jgi:predicted TIM-barrel fold metal-dependent hydrolase
VVARPWQVRTALLNAQALGVLDQILFASGWPATTPAHAIETLYSLNTFSQGNAQPSVPRSEIRTIIERDSLAALGIDRNPGNAMTNETDPSKFKSIRTDEEADQALPVD